MFIKNNVVSSRLYVPYTKTVNKLAQSARRLATGEKAPTAADGAGELGVANRMRLNIKGTAKLLDGVTNFNGFLNSQDVILTQALDIATRMVELAASGLDTTKNTADRIVLAEEIDTLIEEFSLIKTYCYNGTSIFGQSQLSVRVGMESNNILFISTVNLNSLTFESAAGFTSITSASAILQDMKSKVRSINILRARVGEQINSFNRATEFTRAYIAELGNAESAIRNIDLAEETGNFTQQQVSLAAAQSVLAQANGLSQSVLQFLG